MTNAAANGVADRLKAVKADGFELLRQLNSQGRKFDLVILDPPSYVRHLKDLRDGIRAYRDINYQAMKLLTAGGILFSCSCSHHLGWSDLLQVLAQAAQGCGREFQILGRVGAGPDHPVLLTTPETEYLRGCLLRVG